VRAGAGRLMGADMTWVLRLYVNENPCSTNPYMWTPERAPRSGQLWFHTATEAKVTRFSICLMF
jgi:hypothetical protein